MAALPVRRDRRADNVHGHPPCPLHQDLGGTGWYDHLVIRGTSLLSFSGAVERDGGLMRILPGRFSQGVMMSIYWMARFCEHPWTI